MLGMCVSVNVCFVLCRIILALNAARGGLRTDHKRINDYAKTETKGEKLSATKHTKALFPIGVAPTATWRVRANKVLHYTHIYHMFNDLSNLEIK